MPAGIKDRNVDIKSQCVDLCYAQLRPETYTGTGDKLTRLIIPVLCDELIITEIGHATYTEGGVTAQRPKVFLFTGAGDPNDDTEIGGVTTTNWTEIARNTDDERAVSARTRVVRPPDPTARDEISPPPSDDVEGWLIKAAHKDKVSGRSMILLKCHWNNGGSGNTTAILWIKLKAYTRDVPQLKAA